MTENPKSLKELMAETEKVLGSTADKAAEDGGNLNLVDLSNKDTGGQMTRAGSEKPAAETAKPADKKEDGGGALDFAGGTVVGFGKGLVNLVVDTKKLLVNIDDSKIRAAALSGDPNAGTGISLVSSLGKSGSELGTAFSHIVRNPGQTFTGLGKQLAGDWNAGSASKKGEMFGEGLAFAATLGIGTNMVAKGFGRFGKAGELSAVSKFSKVDDLAALGRLGRAEEAASLATRMAKVDDVVALSRLGKGEEAAALAGRLGKVDDLTGLTKLTKADDLTGLAKLRGERLLETGGAMGENTRFLTSLKSGDKAADLSATVRLTGETGSGIRTAGLGDEAAKVGRLETTVADLTKGTTVGREVAAGQRVIAGGSGVSTDLLYSTRLVKTEKALAEFETAGRAITQQAKMAREVGAAGEVGAGGRLATREAQALAREAKAVEDAVTAVRTAETQAARQVAMRELNTSVTRFNSAVDANAATAARAAELKIPQRFVAEFEAAAGRTGELLGTGSRLEPMASKLGVAEKSAVQAESRAQALTSKLDDGKAVARAGSGEGALSVEQKALEVEQSLNKVRTAETAVARERAMVELRSNVQQYNRLIETTPATAARAGELKIADTTVERFAAASREAHVARGAYRAEVAATNLEARGQSLLQQTERGRLAAEGSEASLAVRQQALKVEESVQKARTAQGAVAREQAITEVRTSTQAYNRLIEGNPATAARAGELRIGEKAVVEFETSVRQANHARVMARHEVAVTEAAVQFDARAQAVVQQLDKGRTVVSATSAEGVALRQSAAKVEESMEMARFARTSSDHRWAMEQVRSQAQAYNELLRSTPATAGKAAELRISEQAIRDFQVASKQAHYAHGLADVEIRLSGRYLNNLSGRGDGLVALAPGASGSRGSAVPLSARADGLAAAASETGWFRGGLRKLDESASRAWQAVFRDGMLLQGLSSPRFADLAVRGLGAYIVGRDLYLAYDRTVDRVVRLARESEAAAAAQAQAQGSGRGGEAPAGGAGGERAASAASRQSDATGREGATDAGAGRDAAALPGAGPSGSGRAAEASPPVLGASPAAERAAGSPQQGASAENAAAAAVERASAQRVEQVIADAGAGQNPQAGQVMGRAGRDELALSPSLQAFHAPGGQTSPVMASATARFVAARKEEEERLVRRGDNQFGAEWYRSHVYLKGAEAAAPGEGSAVLPQQPLRRFTGAEPDVPRIITPTFKPWVIDTIRAELAGASAARPGEGRLVSAAGGQAARRGRGSAPLNDQQKLLRQFPFLVTAAGETGITSGAPTGFRAGVENQERRSMGKPGASAAPQPAAGQTDPMLAAVPAGSAGQQPSQDEEGQGE